MKRSLALIVEAALRDRPLVAFNDGADTVASFYHCSWCGVVSTWGGLITDPRAKNIEHKDTCLGVELAAALERYKPIAAKDECRVCGDPCAVHATAGGDHAFRSVTPGIDPNAALEDLRAIRFMSDVKGLLPERDDVDKFITLFGELDDHLTAAGKLPRDWQRVVEKPDWTGGLSNSSPKFNELAADVERLILDSAYGLLHGDVHKVARNIVARLAHVHGLAPGGES